MIERGLYYATDEFSQMIRSVGGTWNDTKRRPIVCLIKSDENFSASSLLKIQIKIPFVSTSQM